ncbi:MAG: hypothetical protein AAF572_12710 [Cyanobacteria bacterium P01_B01_bin.77]
MSIQTFTAKNKISAFQNLLFQKAMFDLVQQISPVITPMPMFPMAKLGSLTIQPVIETIAAQNIYTRLSYFIAVLGIFFALFDRMTRIVIKAIGLDCRFSASNSPRSIYFYIALSLMALAVVIFLKSPSDLQEAPKKPEDAPPVPKEYPKEKCGDDTSGIPSGTKVYMYPIFVDGGDRILQKIRTDFC